MKLPSATESNRREVLAFLFRADEMSIDSIYNSQIFRYTSTCLNNWLQFLENIFRVGYSTFPFFPSRNETYHNTQISCES